MLIVNDKRKDYYDCISAYGVDKTCVYNRREYRFDITYHWEIPTYVMLNDKKFVHNFPKAKFVEGVKRGTYVKTTYLGFCGETHKIVNYYSYKPSHALNPEKDINQYWVNPTDDEAEDIYYLKHKLYRWSKYEKQKPVVFSDDLFFKFKTPVFAVSNYELILNPSLKDLGFQRLYDPYTAHQKIYQFLSGVLGNREKETIDISDKDKITQHGFDSKVSFRHPTKI